MNIAIKSLPSTGPTFSDSETCEKLESTTCQQLTLLPVDFLARMLALPEKEKGLKENGQLSGQSSPVSLAKLSPGGYWLKMYQDSFQVTLDGSLETYSGTWPRSATMRNGTVYRRQPLVPHISEKESSWWPTPTADTGKWMYSPKTAVTILTGGKARKSGAKIGDSLKWDIRLLPEHYETGMVWINPLFLEWLQGYPPNWTEIEPSVIVLSPKLPPGSESE